MGEKKSNKLMWIFVGLAVISVIACIVIAIKTLTHEEGAAEDPYQGNTVEDNQSELNDQNPTLEEFAESREDLAIDSEGDMYAVKEEDEPSVEEDYSDVPDDAIVTMGKVYIVYPENLNSTEDGEKLTQIFGEMYANLGEITLAIVSTDDTHYYVSIDTTGDCYSVDMNTFEIVPIDAIP